MPRNPHRKRQPPVHSIDLSKKVAVITGGNKGIGLATAKVFANHGAQVVITGRDAASLKQAKASISNNTLTIQSDISNLKDLDHLFNEVHKKFGFIDILFVNAGIGKRIPFSEATEELFDKTVDIDYKGSFFTLQKAIPYLNNKASVIINASIAGIMSVMSDHSIYSSAKAALIQLTRSAAGDLAKRKIRVNAISPGYIKTSWVKSTDIIKKLAQEVPLENRFGTPEEIANVALFLASDLSSYMTGQNLVVDGGMTTILQHHF